MKVPPARAWSGSQRRGAGHEQLPEERANDEYQQNGDDEGCGGTHAGETIASSS